MLIHKGVARQRGYLHSILLGATLFGLLATYTPTPARACTAPACYPGALLPATEAEVPANVLALVWRRPQHWTADAGQVVPHLYRTDSGGRTEVAFDTQEMTGGLLRIVPVVAQPPGTQLVLEYNETCGSAAGSTSTTTFRVVEPVALPTSLGKLHAPVTQGPVEVAVATGECSLPLEAARADLEVALSTEATPLASVLRYELMVDGKPAPSYYSFKSLNPVPRLGASALGPGRDRVYALCDPLYPRTAELDRNLGHGIHSVQLIGVLPDNTRIASDAVQVDLSCASRPADGGLTDGATTNAADGSSDDGTSTDATDSSSRDGADGPGGDSGQPKVVDGSSGHGAPGDAKGCSNAEGGPTTVAGDQGDTGGCTVAVPGAASTSGWLLTTVLAGLAARRRRRTPLAR